NHVSINNSSHPGYVKKGALKKMYYPSGGHTSFDYDTPTVATLLPTNMSLFAVKGQPAGGLLPEEKGVDFASINTNHAQDITVNVNVQLTNLSDSFQNERVYIEFKKSAFGSVLIPTVPLILAPGEHTYNVSFNFSLEENASYSLVLILDPTNPLTGAPYIATATTSFVNKTIFPSSGLRVEKISDYPKEGDINPLVKKYYYKRAERALSDNTQEDEESGVVTYAVPTQVSHRLANSSCCSVAPENSGVNYLDFRSDPFSYYFAASDNLVSYKYVTVSLGGDNFEEGGVEKHFKFETNIDPVVVTTPFYGFVTDDFYTLEDEIFVFGSYSDNNTVLNGALLSETHVKKGFVIDEDLYIANDLHKVKETNYTYSLEVLNTTEGLILTPRDNFCLTNDFDVVSLARYKNRSYSFNLVSVKTKEYISKENNPTYQTNDFVETEQTIEYNTSLKFLPSKISNTNSNGDTQITKNYYLTDLDIAYVSNINPQIISSSAQSVAYEYLKDNNRVGAPIFTESYIKKDGGTEQLRSQQRILFNNFGGLTLPETEETSKLGSPLEKRTTYTKYDDKGYILEMSSDNNITTSVIYGYKDKKIIAQLVNVAHGSIVVTGSTVTAIQGLSNVVTDQATMDALEVALDGLRAANPDGRITTYVYNRLGQLSSMKDARGYKMSYEYDECYRLKRVKDHLGNILKENQYNIINNN
ncbi:MAG: hypothetical protein HRT69_16565, partial [Flavobacteriaceae bacterium]|nr:hypothetical protein [Flavobacteriaceae bacterium]